MNEQKKNHQSIVYDKNSIDKHIGCDKGGVSYGLSIFQNSENNVGCYTINNCIYIFDTSTAIVHSVIKIPACKGSNEMKKTTQLDELYCVDFAIINQNLHVVAGGKLGYIYCINLQEDISVKILDKHGGPVHCIKTNPKYPFVIASCGKDRAVKIWDLRSKSSSCDYINFAGIGGHRMLINSVSWHSSGTKVASGGYDLRICLWDIPQIYLEMWINSEYSAFEATFSELIQYPKFSTMMVHTSAVDCILWLDTMLISKGADGELICWSPAEDEESNSNHIDTERLQPVNILLKLVYSTANVWFMFFAYNKANKHIITANTTGSFLFWNLQDLVNKRNEILSTPIEFESDDIDEMRETYIDRQNMICFEPGATYAYNCIELGLDTYFRNFDFTPDGAYCYALSEQGYLVRFKSNK